MSVFTVKILDDTADLSKFDCSENDELALNGFLYKQAFGVST
jgi:hypothetical protein